MKTRLLEIWLTSLVAAALALPCAASADTLVARAGKLMGREAVDSRGTEVGSVHDFVVDTAAGRVTHVILSTGGLLGIGNRHVAFPLAGTPTGVQRDRLLVDADPRTFELLPDFEPRQWTDRNEPGGVRSELLASVLLDAEVMDFAGRDVGNVVDVVFDPGSGRVHHVVASYYPSFVLPGKLVKLEPRRLEQRSGGLGHMAMRVSREELERAPAVVASGW